MGLQQCCGYFGSCVLVLLSAIALLVLLLTYFKHIRTLFYVEGNCTVSTSLYTIQYSCSCGRGCKSYYPCLLLYCHVRSARLDGDTARGPVVLYDDDWQQMFVVNTDNDEAERCSLRTCHESRTRNRDAMQRYKIEHEPGASFRCYFHPSSVAADGAVLARSIHWSLAVHVTLWPGLGVLLGVVTCTYTCYWKRCRRKQYSLEDLSAARVDTERITDPYNNLERY